MGWRVRGSNPGGHDIFYIPPDHLWCPPSHLNNGHRFIPSCKAAGCGVNHPHKFKAKVKETVQLYLYFPSVPSRQVIGWNLLLLKWIKIRWFQKWVHWLLSIHCACQYFFDIHLLSDLKLLQPVLVLHSGAFWILLRYQPQIGGSV